MREAPQNLHYSNLDSKTREAALIWLEREQRGLCAYTMKRLRCRGYSLKAHIEHLLPQAGHTEKTLDWPNLLACVPQPGEACDFGAVRKAAYDPSVSEFTSPLLPAVERQFEYSQTGEVKGLTPAAASTVSVSVLNLNHPALVTDRHAKIRAALRYQPTAAAARRRADELRRPDGNGDLEPYCEALAQVLLAYAARLDAKAARMAGRQR